MTLSETFHGDLREMVEEAAGELRARVDSGALSASDLKALRALTALTLELNRLDEHWRAQVRRADGQRRQHAIHRALWEGKFHQVKRENNALRAAARRARA